MAVDVGTATALRDSTPITSPHAWRTVRFDQMAQNIANRVDNPSEAGVDRYVGLEHLDPESLKIRRWGHPSDVAATKLRFKPGDIIFGRRRAYQRKLAVADFEGICSAHAMVLRAREDTVLKGFLPFFMQSDLFFNRALQISVGSLSPTINWSALSRQEFTIPPLDEQRCITDMLSAADEAIERAVAVNRSLLATLASIKSKTFGNIDSTTELRLADLCEKGGIQIGPFGSQLHASDYADDGVPVIMPADMSGDQIRVDSIARVPDDVAERLSHHRVRPGDILLPRRGDLSKRAYIRPEQVGWICGTGSIRIRVRESVPSRVIFHALSTPEATTWVQSNAVGTTMPNLNTTIVSNIPINVPDGDGLDQISAVLKSLERGLDTSISKLEALRQLKRSVSASLLQGE